jgi:hypothetical protein
MAAKHTKGIKSEGLPVGFYFIPRWSSEGYSMDQAKIQAEQFAKHILSLMNGAGFNGYGDLLPVLDIEPVHGQYNVGLSGKQIVDWARTFCDRFKAYTGRTVMIYTNKSFWSDWGVTPNINTVNNQPLWNAEYYEFNKYLYTSDTPMNFGGWKGWNIWQFTQSTVIGGYTRMDQSWCRSLDLITPPSTPKNLSGFTSASRTVKLAWNPNREIDLKGYNIYMDGKFLKNITNTSIIIEGLTVGKTYKFHVQSVDIHNDVSVSAAIKVYVWK